METISREDYLEGLDEWLADLAKARRKEILDSFNEDDFIEQDERQSPTKKKKKKSASRSPSPKRVEEPAFVTINSQEEEAANKVQDIVSKVISNNNNDEPVFLPEERALREDISEDEPDTENLDLRKVEQFDKDAPIRQDQVVFEDPEHPAERFKDNLDRESLKPLPKCIQEGIVRDLYDFQTAAVVSMIKLMKELDKDPSLLFKGKLILHDVGTGKTLIIDAVVECLLSGFVDKAIIVTTSKVKKQLEKSLSSELSNYHEFKDRIQVINFESFAKGFKTLEEVEALCVRSLLVIDEAHRLRNLGSKKKGKKKEKATASKKIERCSMGAKAVLVTTATPYFKSIQDIYSLLSLIFNPKNKDEILTFADWIKEKKKGLDAVEMDNALTKVARGLIKQYGLSGYYKRVLVAPEIEKAFEKNGKQTVESPEDQLPEWARTNKAALKRLKDLVDFDELKDVVSIYKATDYSLFPQVTKQVHFIDSSSGSDKFVKLNKSLGKTSWKPFLEKFVDAPETASKDEFSKALRGSFAIQDKNGTFYYSPKLKVIYDIIEPVLKHNAALEEELKNISSVDAVAVERKKATRRVLFKVTYLDNLELLQRFLESLGIESKVSVISGGKSQNVQKVVQDFESGKKPFVIITQAGQEGLDFKAIYELIVIDIPFTWSDIVQILGRGIRVNSHTGFDSENLNVHLLVLSNFEEGKEAVSENLITVFDKKSIPIKLPGIDTALYVKAVERRYIGDILFEILNRFSIQDQQIIVS